MMEVNDNTTLRNLQQMVDEWIKTYGVRYFNELTNMACLTEEVGELARIIARQYGEQSFKEGEKPNLGEEMALSLIHIGRCRRKEKSTTRA